VEPLLATTYVLCRDASRGVDCMSRAERAVAFHRKFVEQEIIQLTSEMEDKLGSCEKLLHAGALGSFLKSKRCMY
jgi:hypothetical protein